MSNMYFNRREFLSMLTVSGMSLSLGSRSEGRTKATNPAQERSKLYAAEGARLTEACMSEFWDPKSRMFRAPVLSSETVSSDALHDRGYTLWPSLIAIHALIEGEKQHPGTYARQIAGVYNGLGQYYSTDLSAYTSWLHFPGNTDAYYDDNSWVVIVLAEAAMACRKSDPKNSAVYLDSAKSVMANFIVKGYDDTGHPGGLRWGYDPSKAGVTDRGTSSTAGAALAAMVLAQAGVDREFYTKWGQKLLTWLTGNLLDKDGLIMDALEEPGWKVRTVKWTYNTGVPMRAYVEHYRLTKNADSLSMASKLARASIDRSGGLFDQMPHDPGKRFYWDSTYFVQYLVDGLLQVAKAVTDKKLASEIVNTVVLNAEYAMTSLKDPADGLYWRNWRLYTIGETQLNMWQKWTGQTAAAEFDASERSQEKQYQSLPVKDRPLVKTLLANAGAARLFWLAARLPNA